MLREERFNGIDLMVMVKIPYKQLSTKRERRFTLIL